MGTGYPGAPPGWYPDPAGGPGQRWWDGYAWTEATVLPQQPPPPPWAGAGPPQGPAVQVAPWAVASERLSAHTAGTLVETESRMVKVARVALALPPACGILTLIANRVNSDRWLAVGHQFRVDWHAAQNNMPTPPYHGPSALSPANAFIGLVSIAGLIVALVWQHRAASAGRAIGIPSGQPPGWGVGSWFVPVVNLWIPYLALRDCLPPGDPHRGRVLQWWLAWIAGGILGFATFVCSLFSSGPALGLAVVAAVAYLAAMAWAPGVVTAIGVSHRAAMAQQEPATGVFQG
jgi:uncharacterized protein DUF4328/uncharacterized protein DUF2510